MEKQFVTYEIALKLKKLGFNEECFGFYLPDKTLNYNWDKNPELYVFATLAPLWQQAIDFFREKYKINCVVGYVDDASEKFMAIIDKPNESIDYNLSSVESFYQARTNTILKAIELCQEKKF